MSEENNNDETIDEDNNEVDEKVVPSSDEFSKETSQLNEKVNELEHISSIEIPKRAITVSPNGKLYTVINNTTDKTFKTQKKIYTINFIEPVYVNNIIFDLESGDLNGVSVKYISPNDVERSIKISGGATQLTPNIILKSIEISFKTIFNRKIQNIKIDGYDITHIAKIENYMREHDKIYTELENLNTQIEEKHSSKIEENFSLQESIDSIKSEITSKNDELTELESAIEEETATLSTNQDSNKTLISTNTQLETDIESNTALFEKLKVDVQKEQKALNAISEDKALFAQEVKEYITQANNDVKWYMVFTLIPMFVIVGILYAMFFGSFKLSTVFNENPELNYAIVKHVNNPQKSLIEVNATNENSTTNLTKSVLSKISEQTEESTIDIASVFWTRLPFTIVIISILILCYKLSFFFAQKIMELHHQRRIFTKLFILAKEVSDTTLEDDDFSLEEKVSLRTKLKMNMLREYLKSTIEIDYNHKIEPSLWEKLLDRMHNKIDSFLSSEDQKAIKNAKDRQSKKTNIEDPDTDLDENDIQT